MFTLRLEARSARLRCLRAAFLANFRSVLRKLAADTASGGCALGSGTTSVESIRTVRGADTHTGERGVTGARRGETATSFSSSLLSVNPIAANPPKMPSSLLLPRSSSLSLEEESGNTATAAVSDGKWTCATRPTPFVRPPEKKRAVPGVTYSGEYAKRKRTKTLQTNALFVRACAATTGLKIHTFVRRARCARPRPQQK